MISSRRNPLSASHTRPYDKCSALGTNNNDDRKHCDADCGRSIRTSLFPQAHDDPCASISCRSFGTAPALYRKSLLRKIPEQEADQSRRKPYIRSFENRPSIAVWISDVDGDSVFQCHLFHLAFCRKFLSLAYPSERKRGVLNPSPEKSKKNKTQKN